MAKDHPTGQSGLYEAFLQLKTPEQCYRFLQDVCSYSELSAMEQRYNIAEMLVDKRIYTEIMDKTGASSAIISRVSRVLSANDSVLRALLEAEKAAGKAEKHKPCRVPPGAACGFFCHPTGKAAGPPPRGSCYRLSSGENVFIRREVYFYEQSCCVFCRGHRRNVKPCWWSICCAAPRWR